MARRPARSRPVPPSKPSAPSPPAAPPAEASPRFWTRSRLAVAVLALLSVHLVLAVRSLVLENPTIDEVIHLPAGLSYWQTGTFRLYHHNPPLVKLVAALPVLAAGPITAPLYQKDYWRDEPPNKSAFAHEFASLNAAEYFQLFARARLMIPLFSLVGGLVVFAWSRKLYGPEAGLLSLSLWVFCPNILAHARLVTTDIGATALGVLATFVFWLFLHRPTWRRASLAGLCLGLAQLSKFSMILLYGLWPLLGLVHLVTDQDRTGLGRRLARMAWIVALSVAVIDLGYGFEGVGIPLGHYEFACRSLTRPVPEGMERPRSKDRLLDGAYRYRVNRFRGTLLNSLPTPLPKHYLLGFDDQKLEAEGIPRKFLDADSQSDEVVGYPVYLDGVLRHKSWWYYYLFAAFYKVPEGTWFLIVLSFVVLAASRRSRASPFDELTVLTIPAVLLVVISVFTNINLGLRYILPIFPYLYISAGKLAPWAAGLPGRARPWGIAAVTAGLLATVAATAGIHPHYLAYFNVVSGGPEHGSEHLIDSNLDWGQDLVNLRRWIEKNAPEERIGVAYFGQINPSIFAMRNEGFDWFLPPPRPGTMRSLPPRYRQPRSSPLEPGLYAVSASLVRGLPWRVYDPSRWAPWDAGEEAFSYFAALRPIGHVGHSIFLYRVSPDDAARLAPVWGGGASTDSGIE